MHIKNLFFCLITLAISLPMLAQSKYTISGAVRDSKTGEELIGATVYIKEIANTGAATNAYGFYSLTLPAGKYTLQAHYVGYNNFVQEVNLDSSRTVNINLVPASVEMKQVEVSAQKADENVTQAQMSATKLDIKELAKVPLARKTF
jgi:methylthioribose-1-phosphate isomerase